MTSVPPAEPRPPPPRPPDLLRSRTYSAFGLDSLTERSPTDSSLSRPSESQSLDDRPLKRRKTDHGPPTEANISQQTSSAGNTSRAQPRTRLIGDLRLLSAVLAGQAKDEGSSQDVEPPPLPTRPWKHARPTTTSEEAKPTHRARAILEVPTSPDTMEDPIPAPPLGNKPAGYFPWLGRHPEDVLSETNVKQGYYDHPPNPPDREMNTARVSLRDVLKYKSGVETLSTLFSLVLEAKNKHGLISSASSFKPPPRVTLAEAKRKAWIADLADPNVLLRKLSRTIPQGIRGQLLLDQCIQNAVPLSRAIWFAKCVGANEIRTLKRKGTTAAAAVGTEGKWLREWTTNVEQFLESVLSRSGEPSWRANVQYALRLTTRLYLENLVDRDHYLDWIVKSFFASDNDRLPFWLMVVHIYKHDIVKFRRRAKQLGESLVYKYLALRHSKQEVVLSLAAKLRSTIHGFAMNRAECFLVPDSWPNVREGLDECLNVEKPLERQTLDRLKRANERCMGSNRQQYITKPDPADIVVDILDSTKTPYDPAALSSKLTAACSDMEALFFSCLEWGTSKFRYGSARVYLVARLLRKWNRQGHDVESALLNFVAGLHSLPTAYNGDALSHLMAELSRSHTFPTSKYLQWLNVRGLPRSGTSLSTTKAEGVILQQCSDTGELLMHLSLLDVKSHVVNQRHALLARADFDANVEMTAICRICQLLRQSLNSSEAPNIDIVRLLPGWNWNVRLQISHWIRAFVSEKVKHRIPAESKHPLQDAQPISNRQFLLLRSSLEILGDEAVLADVLGLCSSLDDEQLHASLVETVTRHADALSAIGALEPLRTRLCQMYMSLRSVKSTMPLFATALLELCSSFPIKSMPVRLLQQDLMRGDRGRAVAAFSPFSDGLAESLQQAEATFIEDFEAVLQSEPSMNEQTMSRLFTVLTERIGKQSEGLDEQIQFTYCQLMARLRLCRRQQGDQLMKIWLTKVLPKASSSFVRNLVFGLIGTGSLTIDVLVEAVTATGKSSDLLPRLFPGDTTAESGPHYNVVSKWEDFGRRRPVDMFNLMGNAATASRKVVDERELCTSLVLKQKDASLQLSQHGTQRVERVLKSLLTNGNNPEMELRAMFQSVSSTSLAFVQVCLQLVNRAAAAIESDTVAQSMMDTVFDASDDAPSVRHISVLLQGAGSEIATNVRQLTEEHVLEMLPKLPLGKSSENESLDLDSIQTALEQAFLICQGASTLSVKSNSQLIDRLSQLLKFLGHTNPPPSPVKATATSPTTAPTPQLPSITGQLLNPSTPTDAGPPRTLPAMVIEYFRILLQILCLIRPSTSPSPFAAKQPAPPPLQKSQSDQIKILIMLATLCTHPFLISPTSVFPENSSALSSAAETLSFAYDVMATYVDDLSDEGRALCAKILKDKIRDDTTKDGKMRWLFGSVGMCGSEMRGGEEMGKGLLVKRKGEVKGDWRPRVWEVLESKSGGGRGGEDGETSLGLGLFGARR